MASPRAYFWPRQKPVLLVLASQILAAVVNGLAKTLETGCDRVHPLQILNIRLLITGVACLVYLMITKSADGLWGPEHLMIHLFVRGITGICGAVGFYFSIRYLTLAEATALNFLAPLGSILLAKYICDESFGWVDISAAVAALLSVVCVLQPKAIFVPEATTNPALNQEPHTTIGLLYGSLGVFGGMVSLTAIRYIGTKTNPVIGINYFAWLTVAATTVGLMILPNISWPSGTVQWIQLLLIGLFGFGMEYLLAMGLSGDVPATATVMIYSQIFWAVLFDWFNSKTVSNFWTWFGSIGILLSLSAASLSQATRPPAYSLLQMQEGEEMILHDRQATSTKRIIGASQIL
ncbi:hypothetical protein PFICI_00029 [Pestalotiopsis fici W106-1]|uniref:EamA domain-containing protein n=1 Tax=Pestalotiopsis fici (strain W106-1 / CGMCC3.15140) TaxID=1229662 RepID=W3XLR6_PESFW|nr:uncharacterized protein PFICI_00029 [Pestalotiopsis fici W106-1]ETS86201.1 hypothetical protein PFICI_00029 [Pestalotiopsis fici W106-1]